MSANIQENLIEDTDAVPIIDILNQSLEGSNLDPYGLKLNQLDLSFYKKWVLIQIEDHPINFLYDAATKEIVVLDGNILSIEKANETEGLSLNKRQIAEYIQFYFKFTRGAYGAFQVVETADKIDWQSPPPITVKKSLDGMIKPIVVNVNDRAGFDVEACILFKDSLFNVAIEVSMSGSVTIKIQEVVIKGLNVPDNILS